MNPPLPKAVVTTMARREYRMYHLLWHEIRTFWNQYPRDVQDKIKQLGWEPPRPSTDERGAPILTNNSGEDFFYMHRQLITRANTILAEVDDPSYPQIEGWVRLPKPDDPDFPVPPAWFDPGSPMVVNDYIVRIKKDSVFYARFRFWEKTFTDPSFLRSVSLGKLGALIDYYLLHPFRRRWAEGAGATRPDPGPGDADTIPVEWDDPRYNYLGDYYSMHVNPVYWRFIGWVDDRIEEWKNANGVFGNDFWKAMWVGKMPNDQQKSAQALSRDTDEQAPAAVQGADTLEELSRTIARTGLSSMRVGDGEPLGTGVADSSPGSGHEHAVA